MKNNAYTKSKWMHFKISTLSASITALVVSSIPTQISASDIDIYQAGGTGLINIYFMLDTSGSMGDMYLRKDYGYTSSKQDCTIPNMVSNYDYEKKSNGSRRVSFEFVSNKTGTHNKSGSDYNFVGTGGDYIVTSDKNSGTATRYDRKLVTKQVGTKCENIKICGGTGNSSDVENFAQKLENNLTYASYTYAKQDDYYCRIDSDDLDLQNNDDLNYLKKIKAICEEVINDQQYRCFMRLSNLKKGLLQLVHSVDVGDEHQFALGNYPYTPLGRNAKTTGTTLIDFIKMDASGKENLSLKIENLTASGGTPIAPAYGVASEKMLVGNSISNAKPECSGNGIYFLTDGEPSTGTSYASANFNNQRENHPVDELTDYWQSIARQAAGLRKGINDDTEFKLIKTATVGFGGEYYLDSLYSKTGEFDCSVYSGHQYGLCAWGSKLKDHGQGGFYNAQSAEDIVQSIEQFVSEVSKPVEGSTMGTSTIPVDALNTTQLQPYSYFPMFKPLIGSKEQLWAGNLKKFKVEDGTIVDTNKQSVFEGDTIRKQLADYWYSAGNAEDEYITWGGHLSRLKANNYPEAADSTTNLKRNLYININRTLEKATNVLSQDIALDNRHYLYGLLGFSKLKKEHLEKLGSKEYTDQLAYLNSKLADVKGYQMGSVIHSTPVLLTQKGALEIDKGVISSKDREDYILFGTTQGVLHIVKAGQQDTETPDAEGGKEVFSFVPNEFLTRQSKGFAESLAQERTDSVNTFFYGIDGPWVAHTEYEPLITDFYKKKGEEYILDDDGNKIIESTRSALVVKPNSTKSHQYVYGGLRMGGDSYYALNLSDITKPELMFHIDPQKYKNSTLPEDKTHPLAYMGQSWSKPIITYIKWNGKKKLAMIVGGGYDIKYEKPDFVSSASDPVNGNGLYIFDAENGNLLWWGSSRVDKSTDAENDNQGKLTKYASSSISGMINSIPSRVKVIDRDGDGITDHLYVGDLGGKVFRIDLNPQHLIDKVKPQSFTLNAFTLADLGKRRFYEAPTFTIHKGNSTRYAVLTMGSGDRSSPLYTADDHTDWLVGLYDHTVTNSKLLPQTTITANNLKEIYNTSSVADNTEQSPKMGWYYPLPKTESEDKKNKYQSRILEEGVALANELYVSVFSPQNSTAKKDATECTGGITGQSTIYQFCLPDGECAGTTKPKNIGELGPGIIGLTLGTGTKANQRTFIFNKKPEEKPDEFVTLNKLLPQRWFEYSPYKVKGKSE